MEHLNVGKFSSVSYDPETNTVLKVFAEKIKANDKLVTNEIRILHMLGRKCELLNQGDLCVIVMPFYGRQELFEYLMDPETKTINRHEIIRQMLLCLVPLHERGIIHADVKFENFVVQSVNPLKLVIIDFGLSQVLPCPYEAMQKRTAWDYLLYRDPNKQCVYVSGTCGTRWYMSPEMMYEHTLYMDSDLWAIGILMFELWVSLADFKEIYKNYEYMLNVSKHKFPEDTFKLISRLVCPHKYRIKSAVRVLSMLPKE